MFDSLLPHRRQPTRLPHPWDSPGKNTGAGCHFLLQCMKVNSLGQNTGLGSLSLLQGIFLTQGSNPGILHCRWILLPAEPQGKPKNIGVDSLSLLQWIFPTQELNQGLLHCRWILYQQSYQGSPSQHTHGRTFVLGMSMEVARLIH